MSRVYIPLSIRRLVTERAANQCEYCLLHQDDTSFTHAVDHIIALRHGGESMPENLALACIQCNRNKGNDLTTLDPLTNTVTLLFNPREQNWHEHFQLEGARLVGLTPTGRATVALLRMNDPVRLQEREQLLFIERYPPQK
jgi:hypothetical protein